MTPGKVWKRIFWLCVGMFAAAFVVGIVICLLAAAKLRCPKVRLHGEAAYPGCGKRF